ncbi:MAG: prepilin-type N-terminal cleavage/methylation domain-containing protein [Phycisphaerales bacterium]|nr:MAG: prepilin-type N-terminal cleavage/methylation domain-containing protein [Phycisphaerales bacterium]
MRGQRGFTLIELLVVIAIIALLLAILMPSLRAARDQAKKTTCTAHVKGLVLALRMYTDDYDGKTHDSPNNGLWDNAWEDPPVVKPYPLDHDLAYWGIAYFPYAKNKKIFSCPSADRVDYWPENGWPESMLTHFKYCSYGLNGFVQDRKIHSEFKRHSELIVFQDHLEQRLDNNGDMFHIKPGESISLTQWRYGGTNGLFPEGLQECFRHRGASVTAWLDGHVTEIEDTTGETVSWKWYTGVLDERIARMTVWDFWDQRN